MLLVSWEAQWHGDQSEERGVEVGKDGEHIEGNVLLHIHMGGGCCFTDASRRLLSLVVGVGHWTWTRCEGAE